MKEVIVPGRYFSSVTNPCEKEPLVLTIHPGFKTVEDAHEQARRLGLEKDLYALVRFLDEWYVIVFDTLDREAVIGSELAWQRTGIHNYLKPQPLKDFRLPWNVRRLTRVSNRWATGVLEDLKEVDKYTACFVYREKEGRYAEATAYRYAEPYIILLGITFYERWWTVENCSEELARYFAYARHWRSILQQEIPDAVAINPFRGKVLLADGTAQDYCFL